MKLGAIGGFQPLQIKLKYGTLCVYEIYLDEQGYNIINRYENLSEHIYARNVALMARREKSMGGYSCAL